MAKATARQFVCVTKDGSFRRLDIATAQYPRFEKDILRVGRWEVTTADAKGKPVREAWDVTPRLLSQIVEQFNRFSANGNRCPWIIDHDGGAEERYGDVVGLRIADDGQTLMATHELHEKKYQASFGDEPGDETPQEVSVDVRDNFTDGAGNQYPICLVHVANVVNPVVTNQRGFRRLSFVSKGRQMAKAKDDSADAGADTFSIDEVKKMLADAGYAVPDIATTKESVMASFMALTGGESSDEPADDSGIPPLPMDGNMASLEGASPRVLKMMISKAGRQLSIVNKEKAAIEAARQADAKSAFEAEVETLLTDNKIVPADKPDLIESGKSSGWKLSMLAPFKRLAGNATPTTPASRQLSANGGNGVVPENKGKGPMTKERAKEIRQAAFA